MPSQCFPASLTNMTGDAPLCGLLLAELSDPAVMARLGHDTASSPPANLSASLISNICHQLAPIRASPATTSSPDQLPGAPVKPFLLAGSIGVFV